MRSRRLNPQRAAARDFYLRASAAAIFAFIRVYSGLFAFIRGLDVRQREGALDVLAKRRNRTARPHGLAVTTPFALLKFLD